VWNNVPVRDVVNLAVDQSLGWKLKHSIPFFLLFYTARYIKMTQRVGLRFAEHQALQQAQQQQQAAQQS